MKGLIVLAMAGLSVNVLAFASPAPNPTPNVPITAFRVVDPGIYRGARPDAAGLKALSDLGVRTDLNLEDDTNAVAAESEITKSLGIDMISKPMSGFWAPDDQEVNDILKIVANPANYPIFIHCQHGEDRTGLIVGLYRVFYEQWTAKAAYKEMKKDGFHPILFLLNHYFEDKTGFED